MKILIVDDTPDDVELVCQILEDEAHEVIKAYNGTDCLQLAKEQDPDLILLDVHMPDMDGHDVLSRLQEDQNTRKTIVIFITARYKEIDRVVRGIELGAFDYITKPINGEYLLAKIKSALRIKHAEDKIRNQNDELIDVIKEKETLIREIHHRVKNNMQIITSLLDLQADSVQNSQIREVLRESQSRIHTMAALHETLHESDNLSEIDLQTYLFKIVSTIFSTYLTAPDRIILKTDVDELPISLNKASPLGLIINELISNALKYAFPGERKGEITVSVKKSSDQLALTIADDGVGMPEGLDWRNTNTLGLKLIRSLSEDQLGGTVDMESHNGTRFTIKFKLEA
ncbi:MAG: response regulator [bacterium]